MKYYAQYSIDTGKKVALFTRAWIEIQAEMEALDAVPVALFTRVWIEIKLSQLLIVMKKVALFTRAWIEMPAGTGILIFGVTSPSSRGRGLK